MTTTVDPAAPDLTDAAGFKLWTRAPIRFSDTDAMGHVSNIAYAAYLEMARFDVFRLLYGPDPDLGAYAILAALNIAYRKEVNFPGTLDLGTRLIALGTKSYDLGHGMFKDGDCVATATTTLVSFDYRTRASIPTPEAVRAKLAAL